MRENLEILLNKPQFTSKRLLLIEPLTPLSMVVGLPGKYYRTQSKPTDTMILGMIENALGWHFDIKERNELLKKMKKVSDIPPSSSNSGFTSLLQYHVKITDKDLPHIKSSKSFHFDDLWSQQLKGASFIGGSKNYSYEAVPIMNAVRSKSVTTGDTAAMDKNESKITSFNEGDKIHNNVLRPYFPQYYSSPTQREYVVHNSVLPYCIESSDSILKVIEEALNNPKAPLYLGSNDGWVEAYLEKIA